MKKNIHILLFNPWIYDFAAYDFWIKPIGLLTLGGVLRKLGCKVSLIDCLDRHDPELETFSYGSDTLTKSDGTGKFYRETVDKPEPLKTIPRYYARYGCPELLVIEKIKHIQPDIIFVTSVMTYWYPGVMHAVKLLRRYHPKIPIVLGGTYATLFPQHAHSIIKPDYIIRGEGECKIIPLLNRIFNLNLKFDSHSLDQLPYPVYDLYPTLKSNALLTSRGCPYNCGFCASNQLTSKYRRRTWKNVYNEILYWNRDYNVKHMAFYDDSLILQSEHYIKPLLQELKGLQCQFYLPNGIQPRYIDEELAELFFVAGVKKIRLSFETSDPGRQKHLSAKVTNDELLLAIENLEQAGYMRQDIGVYVMLGLPDQDMKEVEKSVEYVLQLGASVHLASFSPIPGTLEWNKACRMKLWNPNNDALLTNNSLYPIWSNKYGYKKSTEFVKRLKSMMQKLFSMEHA